MPKRFGRKSLGPVPPRTSRPLAAAQPPQRSEDGPLSTTPVAMCQGSRWGCRHGLRAGARGSLLPLRRTWGRSRSTRSLRSSPASGKGTETARAADIGAPAKRIRLDVPVALGAGGAEPIREPFCLLQCSIIYLMYSNPEERGSGEVGPGADHRRGHLRWPDTAPGSQLMRGDLRHNARCETTGARRVGRSDAAVRWSRERVSESPTRRGYSATPASSQAV